MADLRKLLAGASEEQRQIVEALIKAADADDAERAAKEQETRASLDGKNELDQLRFLARELLYDYFVSKQVHENGGPFPAGITTPTVDALRPLVGDRNGGLDRQAYESSPRRYPWEESE